MPRLYVTPSEVNTHPLGIGLSAQLGALASGVLDQCLARASKRCDAYARKRLQAPGSSTLSQNASIGATQISVASTLTLDDLDEQAVVINPGGVNQETVGIASGGVSVTNWTTSSYPGTLNLDAPLINNHSSGETVQYLYKEVSEAGSSSSSDPYTEGLQTQAAQLALAHLPPAHQALTRVVFLKNYPIINISQIEHAFSFINQFNPVSLAIETIIPAEGWYRFNVATVILREGIMRTTYTGGYQTIAEDIKTATLYYLSDELAMMVNPFLATKLQRGKRTQEWARGPKRKTPAVEAAEDLLKRYRRTTP